MPRSRAVALRESPLDLACCTFFHRVLATRYELESASQNLSDVGPAEEGKNDHDSIYEVDVAERFADRSELVIEERSEQ